MASSPSPKLRPACPAVDEQEKSGFLNPYKADLQFKIAIEIEITMFSR